MLIHELSSTECAAILARTHVGRLACAHDNQPYIVPVHFSFDEERRCIYSLSTVGQKVLWMRQNPLVCLAVDDISTRTRWRSVLAFGRYEELDDTVESAEARARAQARFLERTDWWMPAVAKVSNRPERHAVVVYQILIDRLTGRRAG